MRTQTNDFFRALLVCVALCAFGPDAGLAATVDKEIPNLASNELFSFATAAGTVPDNHMVVANLLVNDEATNLVFELRSTTSPDASFPMAVSFSTAPGGATGGNQPLNDDTGARAFTARALDYTMSLAAIDRPASGSGYRIIKLRIQFENGYMYPARTWSVRGTPVGAATNRYSGFWSEGDGDATTVEDTLTSANGRPIIEILSMGREKITGIDFGRLQTNLASDLGHIVYYRVANIGTAALTPPVSPPTVAAPFSISGPDYSWSVPIKPGSVTGIQSDPTPPDNIVSFKFRPVMTGPASAIAQVSGRWLNPSTGSPEPVPSVPLTLTGQGLTTDMIALVDTSGSMCYGYSGGSSTADCVAVGDGRMWQTKQSIWTVYEAYRGLTEGSDNRFGLYTFPDWTMSNAAWNSAGTPPTASAWRPLNSTGVHQTNVQNDTSLPGSGLQPVWNGTPMAAGIAEAHGDLPGGNRLKYIVLFSDGDHNLDSPAPLRTPDDWLNVVLGDGTRIFPIAYGAPGNPGMSATNHLVLQRFSCTQVPGTTPAQCREAPNGEYFAVTDAGTVDVAGIKKAFERVTKTLMGLNSVADPKATLPANGNAAPQVCIEDTAQTMTVMLDWAANQRDAIGLTLTGPHGQNLTPTSAGVTYSESDTGAMYVVKPQRMVGGLGGGMWTLNLDGDNRTPLDYNYSVFTQGPDDVTTNLTSVGLATRGAFGVELDLRKLYQLRRGLPRNLEVYMEVTSPGRSYGTYLADRDFDLRYLVGGIDRVVPEVIRGERATLSQRKHYALETFLDRRFEQVWGNNRINFVDDGTNGDRVAGDHIFTAQTRPLSVDGRYQFRLVIDGVWDSGGCVKRDIVIDRYIPVALPPQVIDTGIGVTTTVATALFPAALATQVNIPAPSGTVRQSVVFEPQDEFGNKLGPGHASEIAISFNGAEPLGEIIDNLDGRYEQVFQYRQGTDPQITVAVAGTTASVALSSRPGYVPPPPTTLPSWWLWVVLAAVVVVILAVLLRRRAGP